MAGQLFDEIKSLDLTGDAPPETAMRAAINMAKVMGSALVEKVGQSSSYQGSNLEMLAANVMASTMTEMKKTVNFTGEIDTDALETLRQSAAQSAESSRTSMETSFRNLEEQGISLAEITEGLARILGRSVCHSGMCYTRRDFG